MVRVRGEEDERKQAEDEMIYPERRCVRVWRADASYASPPSSAVSRVEFQKWLRTRAQGKLQEHREGAATLFSLRRTRVSKQFAFSFPMDRFTLGGFITLLTPEIYRYMASPSRERNPVLPIETFELTASL